MTQPTVLYQRSYNFVSIGRIECVYHGGFGVCGEFFREAIGRLLRKRGLSLLGDIMKVHRSETSRSKPVLSLDTFGREERS
jgi:hypothetical protein